MKKSIEKIQHVLMCNLLFFFALASSAFAQLNENCTVSVLNRTAQVKADGSWALPNVPSNMGPVRARATCVENGITRSGQSTWVTIPTDGTVRISDIAMEAFDPAPKKVLLTAPLSTINGIGQSLQLQVTATYPDGSSRDVTSGPSGTLYTTTNPAIATVSPDGLVDAKGAGRVMITASNESVLSSVLLTVTDGNTGDADGDGIPDAWELANGLNPGNSLDALEDRDGDGLTNKEEYDLGTDINNADTDGDSVSDGEEAKSGSDGFITNPLVTDTDGDGLRDGLEILLSTDPTDPASFDLVRALDRMEITPASVTITRNAIYTEASRKITVRGILIDGSTIDLTSYARGTTYQSQNNAIASFGSKAGFVYGWTAGTTTIQATNSGRAATATVTVDTFTPTALARLSLPGTAQGVDVSGDTAYVAAGIAGLQVVNITNRANPVIAGSVATTGTARNVKAAGNYVYVADGASGLKIIDATVPGAPFIAGGVDTPGDAMDVAVQGTLAFVADGSGGLQVVDVGAASTPAILGSFATASAAKGVDVSGNKVAVAAGSTVFIIDVSDPAHPALLGSMGATDAKDVYIRDNIVYVADADSASGLRAVDMADPNNPVQTSAVGGNLLADVAGSSGFVFGARTNGASAVPIYSILIPDKPVLQATLNFSTLGNEVGSGIAVDRTHVYLAAGNGLYVGQYQKIIDQGGTGPTVEFVSPTPGTSLLAGQTVVMEVSATDDVAVASVSFLVDGMVVHQDDASPYLFDYLVPTGVASLTVSATAEDFSGNTGTSNPMVLSVQPDTVPPQISITSPSDGSIILGGNVADIMVQAVDDANIKFVEFYVDGVLQITDFYPPYQYGFPVPLDDLAGVIYSITAKAADSSGNVAESSISLQSGGMDILKLTNYIGPNDLTYENKSVVINNGTVTVDGPHAFKDLTLMNGGVLTHSVSTTTTESRLELNVAGGITIDSTSKIDVTGKGYLGGYQGSNGYAGRTIGNTATGGSGTIAGGSYGGVGDNTGTVAAPYGSLYNPNEPGSGGGAGFGFKGGNGGGLVRITATGITLHGNILADGNSSNAGAGGGGGVYIKTATLTGTGSIAANGGFGYSGGGGRVALYYNDMSGFDHTKITAYGGSKAGTAGGAGTVYLKSSTQVYGDLIIDNNNSATTGYSTPLPSVGTGVSTGLTANGLTDTTKAWRAGDLAGIYLNPNTSQNALFRITANSAASLTTDVNSGNITTVAVAGNTYQGQHIFDHLYIVGSARVQTGDFIKVVNPTDAVNNVFVIEGTLETPNLDIGSQELSVSGGGLITNNLTTGTLVSLNLTNSTMETSSAFTLTSLSLNNSSLTIYNNLNAVALALDNNAVLSVGGVVSSGVISILNGSMLTHPVSTTATQYRLEVNTNILTVDSTSRIDVTGKGYLGGYQGSNGYAGRTIGNTATGGSGSYAGGSYGGVGDNTGTVAATYGSLYNPNELGSGGGTGCCGNKGGNGGGLVRITATGITLNGNILADGNSSNGGAGGGGGVYVKTGTLTGTGSIAASGGFGYSGGGGRVALYYDDMSGFDHTKITAYGGNKAGTAGGAGTIYLKSSAQVYGDLIIDNNNSATIGYSTPLPSVGTGVSTGLTANILTDTTKAWRAGDFAGIYLNPYVYQTNTPSRVFPITANEATTITVDNTGGNLTDVGYTGAFYIGEHYFDNVSIVNGASVKTVDNIFANTLNTTGGALQSNNLIQ